MLLILEFAWDRDWEGSDQRIPWILNLSSWGVLCHSSNRQDRLFRSVCIHVSVQCSHVPLPTFGFCLLCFLGSGIDYPSDCTSWLQRLGLAKSKVGRNSSSGPDKAPSFHCPDAVNSAGGKASALLCLTPLGYLDFTELIQTLERRVGRIEGMMKGKWCVIIWEL